MAIIDDDALLKDSIQVLIDNLGIDEEKAKEALDDNVMGSIVNLMYVAQEAELAEIANKILRNEDGKPA